MELDCGRGEKSAIACSADTALEDSGQQEEWETETNANRDVHVMVIRELLEEFLYQSGIGLLSKCRHLQHG
jgi:hypothetical protein